MILIVTATILSIIGSSSALHCDKEYNQLESFYERGYDIKCEGLTNNFTHLLQHLEITNEISLTMDNCTLTDLSPSIFDNVKNIKHLHINNSSLTYNEYDPIFQLLEQLEDLKVINTRFKLTKNSLKNLSLKTLTLSNNSINYIDKDAFVHSDKLEELHIVNNELKDVSNINLCGLKSLLLLNYSRNKLEELVLKCEEKFKRNVFINSKKVGLGEELMNATIDLQQIDLSYNKLIDLTSTFGLLKSLRVVKLRGNKLSRLNASYFIHTDYLEYLDVSDNDINYIEDDIFEDKQFIESINLSNNKIKYVNLKYLNNLRTLNAGFNNLDIKFLYTININNLRTLYINNNNIKTIPDGIFIKYNQLLHLHLNDNEIVFKSKSFTGLNNLKELYVNNNKIKALPDNLFDGLRNLITLDLSVNNLTYLNSDCFNGLKQLEKLNLSQNYLTTIDYSTIEPLQNLIELDISHNKLYTIDYDKMLSNLSLLNVLDIKFNNLSCDLLSKIILYLQKKGVSYTLQNKIDLDKVNVGGIYCDNNNYVNKNVSVLYQKAPQKSVMYNVTLSFVIILVIVVICLIIFKTHIYLKRRLYRADEFELIDET